MFIVYSITGAALNVNDNRNFFRISNLTIKQRITTTKNFLKYYNIEMSPRRFKIKLDPKIIRQGKIYVGEMEIDINGLHLDEIKLRHGAFCIDPYFITGRFECVIDIERDLERRNTNDLVLKLGKNKYEIYDFKLIEPHVT